MDYSRDLLLLWSVITLSFSVSVCLLLLTTITYLMHRRLQGALSSLDQTLQLCASALLKIAGDSLTAETEPSRELLSRTVGMGDRT